MDTKLQALLSFCKLSGMSLYLGNGCIVIDFGEGNEVAVGSFGVNGFDYAGHSDIDLWTRQVMKSAGVPYHERQVQ